MTSSVVVPSVRRPCASDECRACRSENQDYCVTGRYTERGIFGAHGFVSEWFVDEARVLFLQDDIAADVIDLLCEAAAELTIGYA